MIFRGRKCYICKKIKTIREPLIIFKKCGHSEHLECYNSVELINGCSHCDNKLNRKNRFRLGCCTGGCNNTDYENVNNTDYENVDIKFAALRFNQKTL